VEDRLKEILSTVNDWLRYAEVKNGALLTFASGLGLALVKNYPRFVPGSKVEWCYLTAIVDIRHCNGVSHLIYSEIRDSVVRNGTFAAGGT
jgi:hypothetical protein